MKISDLELLLVEGSGGNQENQTRSLLVRLTTAANLEGWGEASAAWRSDELAARRNALLPVLVGRSVFDIEELLALDELRDPALRAALESASWDLIARALGQPLCHLFGGSFRRRVPLTIRVPSGPAAGIAQLSRELSQQGFHAQVILSSGKPEEDVRTINTIRENVGEHIQLRLNGQGRYDLQTARDLCAELEYAQIECLLDPLLVMELPELAALGHQVNVPLGACRPLRAAADVLLLARLGSIPMAVIDLERVGGLTAARKCAAVAEAAGLSMSLGCSSWSGLAAAAMVQLAAASPVLRIANQCDYDLLNHHLLADAPEVVDGLVAVPQGPGLGVEPDRAKLERCQAG